MFIFFQKDARRFSINQSIIAIKNLNLLNRFFFSFLKFWLRESVSKLVCDWEGLGLGGLGGELVHDDSIIKIRKKKLRMQQQNTKATKNNIPRGNVYLFPLW